MSPKQLFLPNFRMQRPYFIVKKQELQKFLKSKKTPKPVLGPGQRGCPRCLHFPGSYFFFLSPFGLQQRGWPLSFGQRGVDLDLNRPSWALVQTP